jgi:chondroitin AC lyase
MVRQYGILIFFLFSTWYVSAYIPNDDISLIRERVLELMIWPAKGNISGIVKDALTYTHTLNSSCYWPDIDYYDQGIVNWLTEQHASRITTMLQALTVNGSTVQNDPKIRTAAHCALNVWLVNDWQNPNWWFNEIGIPLHTTSQLLMLGDNATSLEIAKIKEISFRAAWWLHGPSSNGANLVWMIQVELYRSLATNNATGLQEGFNQMWKDIVMRLLNRDGLQHDWTYHFHGKQLLSGAYGMYWGQNIFSFIVCTANTSYAPTGQQLYTFAQFIALGDAWMIIGNNWDWHVIGRNIARPNGEYHVEFDTKSIRILAELVQSKDLTPQLNNLADRLDGLSNATSLIGNNHFFVSDYQIHRRANWTAALTMQSVRTTPTECINDENLKGENSGQGVLNLYSGNTYAYDNIAPLLDWQAINGITVEHDIPLENCTNALFPWIKLPFVGGVSDHQYGLAMMDTASHNLTAQRSWHFYDDAIIALATNLTLTTKTTAWTTLASRLLPTGKITIGFFNSTIITLSDGYYSFPYVQGKTSNVQWIHVGESDIGYLLQSQQKYASLGIELRMKTGSYNDLGPYNTTVTARTLTIWIDHGVGPYTLDYNYMILPNVSLALIPALIKQYNDEQVFSCMSINNKFHGIMWPSLKRASFVLWQNITTTFSCKSALFEINIELSEAGAYLFSETTTDFTVTASQPTNADRNGTVIVDRVGTGKRCSASLDTNASKTTVAVPLNGGEFLGQSTSIRCKK